MSIFLNFHCSKSFLLVDYLILHAILLFNLEIIELFLLVVLLFDYLGLFALFSARLEDCFLHLALLILSLPIKIVVVVSNHALVLVLHLIVINFLDKMRTQVKLCTELSLITAYLLNTIFISLLQSQDLIRALLCIVNFLPCFLLFLLKKCDTVRKKLSISLNTMAKYVR